MQLRFATGGAAEGWARVRVAASPYLLGTEKSVLHDMVQVHPDHRGRGVGRTLLDRLLPVVDGVDLTALVNGDEHSLAVAAHWGFAPEREHRVSSLDPRTSPSPGATPTGLRVTSLQEAGARAVWACLDATAADDPSGLTRRMPFEEYLATDREGPLCRADLGQAVLSGGTVLAYSQVDVSGDRAWSTMTGCLPDHRGRGLATLAKAHTLRAVAAAGVTLCSTGNDEENRSMLAVNTRLGYRPTASMWSARRAATPATP